MPKCVGGDDRKTW